MIEKTVIIGHGPSLKNSGNGKYIDSFKNIIRFPYLKDWQVPIDYGIRTSHVCATTQRAKKFLRPTLPESGYFIWSKNNQPIEPELKFIIRKFGGKNITKLINRWQSRLPESDCERYFSHGTAAVCAAAAILKLPVIVLGCDSLNSGINNAKKYVGSWKYENRKQNKRTHDFESERKIIDEIKRHYKIDIRFE